MTTSGGREVELKLRVEGQAALDALARAAGGSPERPARQRNVFFDDDAGSLRRARYALRLRDEDSCFFLTAKGPEATPSSQQTGSSVVTSRPEEERQIDAATAARILNGTDAPLDVLAQDADARRMALVDHMRELTGGAPLAQVGAFDNVRTRLASALEVAGRRVPLVLELDRTTFPGDVVHYEVEVEIPADVRADAAEAAVRALLARAGVAGTPAPSKASRFFAALEGKAI